MLVSVPLSDMPISPPRYLTSFVGSYAALAQLLTQITSCNHCPVTVCITLLGAILGAVHQYAGEAAALLPVVGMMLQFSPAELKRCQDALVREKAAEGIVDASAMNSVDGSASEYGMLSGWTSWAFGGPAEDAPKRPSVT